MELDFQVELSKVITADLKALPQGARKALAEMLFGWLSLTAVKKPVADLGTRLEDWRKRFEVLAETLVIECVKGEIVVKAAGDADSTLRLLERGSSWFEPYEEVRQDIAAALLGYAGI